MTASSRVPPPESPFQVVASGVVTVEDDPPDISELVRRAAKETGGNYSGCYGDGRTHIDRFTFSTIPAAAGFAQQVLPHVDGIGSRRLDDDTIEVAVHTHPPCM